MLHKSIRRYIVELWAGPSTLQPWPSTEPSKYCNSVNNFRWNSVVSVWMHASCMLKFKCIESLCFSPCGNFCCLLTQLCNIPGTIHSCCLSACIQINEWDVHPRSATCKMSHLIIIDFQWGSRPSLLEFYKIYSIIKPWFMHAIICHYKDALNLNRDHAILKHF